MPGRGGFEVIEQVGQSHMPITIFVTAHSQYAIQACEVHALDYLTKPVQGTTAGWPRKWRRYEKGIRERLLVPDGREDFFVDVAQIEWIEAADYYCCLHLVQTRRSILHAVAQTASTF